MFKKRYISYQKRLIGLRIWELYASKKTKKLEAVHPQKIDDLEAQKKSILQKTFRSELIEPAGELESPEGAASVNDGYSPSGKKTKNKISPKRA